MLECAYLLDTNKIDYEWSVAGLKKDDEIVNIAARSIRKPISKNPTSKICLLKKPLTICEGLFFIETLNA